MKLLINGRRVGDCQLTSFRLSLRREVRLMHVVLLKMIFFVTIIKPIVLFAESRAEVMSQIKGPFILKNIWIGMDPKDFNGYKSVSSRSLVSLLTLHGRWITQISTLKCCASILSTSSPL